MVGTRDPDFRAFFESAPGLYLILDPDLKIIAASDAYLLATMTERTKIFGHGFFDVFPENENLRASLDLVLRLGIPNTMAVQDFDARPLAARGDRSERKQWRSVNTPLKNGGGEILRIIHQLEDVTAFVLRIEQMEAEIGLRAHDLEVAEEAKRLAAEEKKLAEVAKLRAEEEKVLAEVAKKQAEVAKKLAEKEKDLAETAKKLAEKEKRLAEVEKELAEEEKSEAEAAKKLAAEEKILAEGEKKLAEKEKRLAEVEKALAEEEKAEAEAAKKLAEEEKKQAEVEKKQAEVEKKLAEAEKKQAEEEKQLAEIAKKRADEEKKRADEEKRRADSANRELEAFSYSVAHDLRAPLRGIDGFSNVLLEDYHDKLDAEGRGHLERIRSGCQRMGHLIDDLLNLASISRSPLRSVVVDLSSLAETVAAEMQATEPTRKVEFKILKGVAALGDHGLLQIIMQNLIGNAWKYTGKTANAVIEFGEVKERGQLTYFVRDNGAGFNMEYADKLFGVFQRLHSKQDFPGTGVGLATVRRIINRHDGEIWADSAVGLGATFHFVLGQARKQGDV